MGTLSSGGRDIVRGVQRLQRSGDVVIRGQGHCQRGAEVAKGWGRCHQGAGTLSGGLTVTPGISQQSDAITPTL